MRIVDANTTEQDKIIAQSLRPTTFTEFIGQKDIIHRLMIALNGAKSRNEPMDHVLFIGEPGLGKTTLARIIAGDKMNEAIGSTLTDMTVMSSMCNIVLSGDASPAVFIDEIHSIKRSAAEVLYPVMEDLVMPATLGRSSIEIPKFTLIGATTDYGKIPAPLRNRFIHVFRITPYAPSELSQMLVASSQKLNTETDGSSLDNIAQRSRGVPRLANRFLKIIRDYSSSITNKITEEAFGDLGIDEHGLDPLDRSYMDVLRQIGRPVGVSTIAGFIGSTEAELEQMVEPYLLRNGFIVKTPKGRALESKGMLAIS